MKGKALGQQGKPIRKRRKSGASASASPKTASSRKPSPQHLNLSRQRQVIGSEEIGAALLDLTAYRKLCLTSEQHQRLCLYGHLLSKANQQINLTALQAAKDIAKRHFLDCLMLEPWVKTASKDARFIDIGSGAGFPGLVVAILRPDLRITLIEPLQKRCQFLRQTAETLGLDQVEVLSTRAEVLGRDQAYRAQAEWVSCRAVAALPVVLEYALPFLQVETGRFLAMRQDDEVEQQAAAEALKRLGATCCESESRRYQLEEDGAHFVILAYKQERAMPPQYPRQSAAIMKRPLLAT